MKVRTLLGHKVVSSLFEEDTENGDKKPLALSRWITLHHGQPSFKHTADKIEIFATQISMEKNTSK